MPKLNLKRKTFGESKGKGIGISIIALASALALWLWSRGAEAAPPEPPPPGLANLYGKVTDTLTGKAISNVLITLNGLQASTDSNGNYTLVNLEPGGYVLMFTKEGYKPAIY